MYGFFLKSDSGISKEEFDDFIFIALESYGKISHKEVSCEELKKIAGGNLGVKVSSGVLSLITLIPYSGSFSAKDLVTTETASGIVVNTKSKIQDAAYYVTQAEKNGFIRIANWIKNNPRKAALIALGLPTAVIAGGLIYKYKQFKSGCRSRAQS